jgi:hypothetical protein
MSRSAVACRMQKLEIDALSALISGSLSSKMKI